jgi:hypothetical protein
MPRSASNAFEDRNRLSCFISADCMALTVVAFGTRTSKGSAFSSAIRINMMRTASETDTHRGQGCAGLFFDLFIHAHVNHG